jgi:hypothetical protein
MKQYFLTNISNLLINLEDFDLFLSPRKTINLSDPKLGYSQDQIEKSIQSGTLNKKKKFLVIGTGKPQIPIYKPIFNSEDARNSTTGIQITNFKPEQDLTNNFEGDQKMAEDRFVEDMLDDEETELMEKLKKRVKPPTTKP